MGQRQGKAERCKGSSRRGRISKASDVLGLAIDLTPYFPSAIAFSPVRPVLPACPTIYRAVQREVCEKKHQIGLWSDLTAGFESTPCYLLPFEKLLKCS